MNAKSCSETAVQSSFREVVEEGQQYVRMESFDMNAKSCSETAVQSSFREVVEEGQQYVRMESFEYIF